MSDDDRDHDGGGGGNAFTSWTAAANSISLFEFDESTILGAFV